MLLKPYWNLSISSCCIYLYFGAISPREEQGITAQQAETLWVSSLVILQCFFLLKYHEDWN